MNGTAKFRQLGSFGIEYDRRIRFMPAAMAAHFADQGYECALCKEPPVAVAKSSVLLMWDTRIQLRNNLCKEHGEIFKRLASLERTAQETHGEAV